LNLKRQEIQQLQQHLVLIKQEYNEIAMVLESINNLKGLKKSDEILAPIGGGIFIETKINDPEKILMNVGGNVIVKKNISDAKDIIEKQASELKTAAEEIDRELSNMVLEMGAPASKE